MYSASTAPTITNQTKGTNWTRPSSLPCLSTPLVRLLGGAVQCQLPALSGRGVNAGSPRQTAAQASEQCAPPELNTLSRRSAREQNFTMPAPIKASVSPSDVWRSRWPERLGRKEAMPGAKGSRAVFHLQSVPRGAGGLPVCEGQRLTGCACLFGQ